MGGWWLYRFQRVVPARIVKLVVRLHGQDREICQQPWSVRPPPTVTDLDSYRFGDRMTCNDFIGNKGSMNHPCVTDLVDEKAYSLTGRMRRCTMLNTCTCFPISTISRAPDHVTPRANVLTCLAPPRSLFQPQCPHLSHTASFSLFSLRCRGCS